MKKEGSKCYFEELKSTYYKLVNPLNCHIIQDQTKFCSKKIFNLSSHSNNVTAL